MDLLLNRLERLWLAVRISSTLMTCHPNSVCTGVCAKLPVDREGRLFEGRHHLAAAEETEITTALAGLVEGLRCQLFDDAPFWPPMIPWASSSVATRM